MNLVTSLDLYGKQYAFNIAGGNYKTFLGGLASLITITSYVALGWYFGQDLWKRESPNFITRTKFLDDFPLIEKHNIHHTFLALKVSSNVGKQKEYFDYVLRVNKQVWDPKRKTLIPKSYKKNLVKCNENHAHLAKIKKYNLDTYYCADYKDKMFGGPDKNGTKAHLTFEIHMCNNRTASNFNVKCKSLDHIIDYFRFRSPIMSIYHGLNLINPANFSKPYHTYLKYEQIHLELNPPMRIFRFVYNFKTADLLSDHGWITDNYKNRQFWEFDTKNFEVEPNMKNRSLLTSLTIQPSKLNMQYDRSYILLPDVIANVGGFIGLFESTFVFLYEFYLDANFNVYLYKRLFNLQIDDAKENPNEQKKLEDIKEIELQSKKLMLNKKSTDNTLDISSVNLNKSAVSENSPNKSIKKKFQSIKKAFKAKEEESKKKEVVLNKEIKNLINFKQRKRKEIEISFWERIHYMFCCYDTRTNIKLEKKIRYELLIAAETEIENKTEIFEVWKMFDQFRLLKKIVLNESQCFMMKNRAKQLINNETIKSNQSNEAQILEESKFQNEENKMREYLKLRKEEGILTSIDYLLHKYLDEEMKEKLNSVVVLE